VRVKVNGVTGEAQISPLLDWRAKSCARPYRVSAATRQTKTRDSGKCQRQLLTSPAFPVAGAGDRVTTCLLRPKCKANRWCWLSIRVTASIYDEQVPATCLTSITGSLISTCGPRLLDYRIVATASEERSQLSPYFKHCEPRSDNGSECHLRVPPNPSLTALVAATAMPSADIAPKACFSIGT
jgi:hypothetical protein